MCEHNHILTTYQYDPTRTTTLRNLFASKMEQRFRALELAIINKVVREDFFELKGRVTTHIEPFPSYLFPRSAQKIEEFMIWLQQQVDKELLTVTRYEQIGRSIEDAWTNLYITDSYKRGIIRARYELQKAGYDVPSIEQTGGIEMSMMTPLHIERLGLLFTRTYSDLKGVTAAMDAQISRVLAMAMADGDGADLIARKLLSVINGSGIGDLSMFDKLGRFIPAKVRADMIARTEIIRAYNQGAVQEYMNWGEIGVYVDAEVVTAGDERVCSKCEALAAGSPYTLEVAMNMLPAHTRCRCFFLPYERGVDTLIPKRR